MSSRSESLCSSTIQQQQRERTRLSAPGRVILQEPTIRSSAVDDPNRNNNNNMSSTQRTRRSPSTVAAGITLVYLAAITTTCTIARMTRTIDAFVVPSIVGASTSRRRDQAISQHRPAWFQSLSLGSSSSSSQKSSSSSDNNNNNNEWGIPHSSDLPPLYKNYKGKRAPSVLPNGGRVTLVGSGPGDPDLLTVKTHRLLSQPDDNTLVIVDRLVSPEIRQLIQGDYKVARKLPGCADLAQEEIYWWMYQALNQGKHVIRLKIGDPFVFGRGGEEVLTCRRFGVEPIVVPGVSAAFSAPLLGHIPVTHRGVANQVVMCTGYGREGTSPDLIRYHDEQTIVFLMAVGRLKELCTRLIEKAGYPADTPVAIVEKAGCPDQRTVVGDMTTIGDMAVKYNVQPPSTIVVGKVVNVLLEEIAAGEEGHVTGLVQNFTASVY